MAIFELEQIFRWIKKIFHQHSYKCGSVDIFDEILLSPHFYIAFISEPRFIPPSTTICRIRSLSRPQYSVKLPVKSSVGAAVSLALALFLYFVASMRCLSHVLVAPLDTVAGTLHSHYEEAQNTIAHSLGTISLNVGSLSQFIRTTSYFQIVSLAHKKDGRTLHPVFCCGLLREPSIREHLADYFCRPDVGLRLKDRGKGLCWSMIDSYFIRSDRLFYASIWPLNTAVWPCSNTTTGQTVLFSGNSNKLGLCSSTRTGAVNVSCLLYYSWEASD